jgi:alpha-tubulin suppressor-like RCC1 family protein
VQANIACWDGATVTPVPTLTGDVASVSEGSGFGDAFACAVTTAGEIWCWGGDNSDGQLGNGRTSRSPVPVPVPVSGLSSGVASVSAGTAVGGGAPAACAVSTDGRVWCWGYDGYGILGNFDAGSYCAVPVEVTGFTGSVTAVSVGEDSACAITSGGGVECWGLASNGQLGNGSATTTAVSKTPVQVTGLTNGVTAISVGSGYACAIVGGGVECWGQPSFGTTSSTPVPMTGLSSGVTSISVGNNSACAVIDGGVQCWGANYQYQLGDNSMTPSPTPVPVSTLTSGVVSVAAAGYTGTPACALTSSGTVWCWGGTSAAAGVPSLVAGL